MAAKRWAYSWPGVTGSVDALSAARARKLIREKHQLKWVPNGAKVVRMDGTAYTPSVAEPAQPTAAVSQPDLSQQIATAVSTAQVGHCCPSCHQAYPKPKAVKVVAAVDLATLSQKELFAYYKRTAPVEDVRFMLRVTLSDGLRERVQALADAAPTMTRTNVYKALVLLQAAWRGERPGRSK